MYMVRWSLAGFQVICKVQINIHNTSPSIFCIMISVPVSCLLIMPGDDDAIISGSESLIRVSLRVPQSKSHPIMIRAAGVKIPRM